MLYNLADPHGLLLDNLADPLVYPGRNLGIHGETSYPEKPYHAP